MNIQIMGDAELASGLLEDYIAKTPVSTWKAKSADKIQFGGNLNIEDGQIVYTMQAGDTANAVSTALFEQSLRQDGLNPERYKNHNPEGYQADLHTFWNETLENSGLSTDYNAAANRSLKVGSKLVLGSYENHGEALAAFLPADQVKDTALAVVSQTDREATIASILKSTARFGSVDLWQTASTPKAVIESASLADEASEIVLASGLELMTIEDEPYFASDESVVDSALTMILADIENETLDCDEAQDCDGDADASEIRSEPIALVDAEKPSVTSSNRKQTLKQDVSKMGLLGLFAEGNQQSDALASLLSGASEMSHEAKKALESSSAKPLPRRSIDSEGLRKSASDN